MALDSCNQLQRIDDVDLRPRHRERIYRKRVLVPTSSITLGDIIGIDILLPELNVVFELDPDHVQDMADNGDPGMHERGLYAILFDLGIVLVEVV